MSEQDNEVLETIISNEEENFEEEIETSDDDIQAQLEAERIAKQQILARAKKAEAELKQLKEARSSQNTNSTLKTEDIEVTILKAQGIPQDEIDYLKKLAHLNGTSIIDAQSDDIYKSFKSKKDETMKAEKARLGASRGSGSVRKEKSINSPGLTSEEHKALWRQQNGN